MPTVTLTVGNRDYRPWTNAFRKYAEWNGRDGAELFVDQTTKLAYELYEQTVQIAPTEAEITADVERQGWKIPRKFADGRMGRGWPAQWLGWDYLQALKKKLLRKKRGRGAKAFNDAQEDTAAGRKATLQDMQKFVIAMRVKARLYLASGWLGGIVDLGGTVKGSSGKVDPDRGGAIVTRGPGSVEITLWNATPGIETMNDKKQFVAKAISVRWADMWVYIRRKMDEAARQYFKAA